jgi:hypothetical protein
MWSPVGGGAQNIPYPTYLPKVGRISRRVGQAVRPGARGSQAIPYPALDFFPSKSPWKAGENLARLSDGPAPPAYDFPHPLPSRPRKLLKKPCVSAYGLREPEPFFFAPYLTKWQTKNPLSSPNGLQDWARRMSAPYRSNCPDRISKRAEPAARLTPYSTPSCYGFRLRQAPPGRVVSSGAVVRLCSSRAT